MNREDILKNIIERIDYYYDYNEKVIKNEGFDNENHVKHAKNYMHQWFLCNSDTNKIDYTRSDMRFFNSFFKINMGELLLTQELLKELKEFLENKENSFCVDYIQDDEIYELRIREKDIFSKKSIYHCYTFNHPHKSQIGEAKFELTYYSLSCVDLEKESIEHVYI